MLITGCSDAETVSYNIGSLNDELEVVCKIGKGEYQKHLLYLAEETTYVVEQLDTSEVSKYDYEFIFRPEAIIPIKIETEIGDY